MLLSLILAQQFTLLVALSLCNITVLLCEATIRSHVFLLGLLIKVSAICLIALLTSRFFHFESKKVLVLLVIALKLNASIVQLMTNQLETTARSLQHDVDRQVLEQAAHLVEEDVDDHGVVRDSIGQQVRDLHAQREKVKACDHVGALCIELKGAALGDCTTQEKNSVGVENQGCQDDDIVANVEVDH